MVQIPVNEKKGLTFARGLRSILRHDPDKILVGEIRDPETAQIAVQAALTGHLVLTTVHANSVFDVIGRLGNMKQGGVNTAMSHHLDAAAGTLSVRFARGGPGVSGDGALASFTFRVKDGAPTARVQTLAVSPVGPGNQPLTLAPQQPHKVTVSR